jgi:biopolymer transport protein ExbB/biopolymer transport protein TolQ
MQFTLTDLWAHMGLFARLIVGAMAIMSSASLLVAFERFITLRKSGKNSLAFARNLGPIIRTHGLDAAAEAPAGTDLGHLGRVLEAGLIAYRSTRHAPEVAVESVARALERQSQREVQTLKKGQGLLATVSSTAPFVGLLGTVMGIVNSFQLMANSGSAGLATVSAGIAEALITTAFGLLVAIPAVMTYNYFQGWIENISVDIAESSNELLDHVARRLTHRAY